LPLNVIGFLGNFPTPREAIKELKRDLDPHSIPAVVLHYKELGNNHRRFSLVFLTGKICPPSQQGKPGQFTIYSYKKRVSIRFSPIVIQIMIIEQA